MYIHFCGFLIFAMCTTVGTGNVGMGLFATVFHPCWLEDGAILQTTHSREYPRPLPTWGFTLLSSSSVSLKKQQINKNKTCISFCTLGEVWCPNPVKLQSTRPHDFMPGATKPNISGHVLKSSLAKVFQPRNVAGGSPYLHGCKEQTHL